MSTFAENASANLAEFGWTVAPDQIPATYTEAQQAMLVVQDWWSANPESTQHILEPLDIADGLQAEGLLDGWPAMYDLLAGNRFGQFTKTFNDIVACLQRADHAASGEG